MNSFSESQRFTQWWLWAILLVSLVSTVLPIYGLMHPANGAKATMPAAGAFVPLVVISIVILLFVTIKLTTTIDSSGVTYRFSPIHFRPVTITWDELDSAYVRQYSPLAEYGGWGIRYSFGNGKAYNISGNMGLQLVLKNGKKILIGTQEPDEIRAVLSALQRTVKINTLEQS